MEKWIRAHTAEPAGRKMRRSFDDVADSPMLQSLMDETFSLKDYGVLLDPNGTTSQGKLITAGNKARIDDFVTYTLANKVHEQYRAGIKEKLRVIALEEFPLAGHHGRGGEILEHTHPTGYLDKDVFFNWVKSKKRDTAAGHFAVWLEHEYREHILGESHADLEKDPRYQKTLRFIESILKRKADRMVSRGVHCYKTGQRETAEFLFSRVRALDPKNVDAICWIVRMKTDTPQRAAQAAGTADVEMLVDEARQIAPDNMDVLEVAAYFYAAQKQHNKAVEMIGPALAVNPNNLPLLELLKDIYLDAGNISSALSVYGQMLLMLNTAESRMRCLSIITDLVAALDAAGNAGEKAMLAAAFADAPPQGETETRACLGKLGIASLDPAHLPPVSNQHDAPARMTREREEGRAPEAQPLEHSREHQIRALLAQAGHYINQNRLEIDIDPELYRSGEQRNLRMLRARAMGNYNEVLKLDTQSIEAMMGKTKIDISLAPSATPLIRNKQLYDARDQIQAAEQIAPGHPRVLETKAYLAASRWHNMEALSLTLEALRKDPHSVFALELLSKIFLRLKDVHRAIEIRGAILRLVFNDEELVRNYSILSSLYFLLLKTTQNEEEKETLSRKMRVAAHIAAERTALNPISSLENKGALFALGLQQDTDAVLKSIDSDQNLTLLWKNLSPEDEDTKGVAGLCLGLGLNALDSNNNLLALLYFQKAAQLNPTHVYVWEGLAKCCMDIFFDETSNGGWQDVKKDHLAQAEEAIHSGLAIDPRNLNLFKFKIESLVVRERIDEAISVAEHMLTIDPDSSIALEFLLNAYARQGGTDKAIEMARRLVERASHNAEMWPRVMSEIALLHGRSGKPRRKEMVQKALDLSQYLPPQGAQELRDVIDMLGLSDEPLDSSL